MSRKTVSVLIPFNTVSLYGMERSVIETFDLLRPEVKAHFLLSHATARQNLPVLEEIKARGLEYSFFTDTRDWPRIGRPQTFAAGRQMVLAMIRGNRDVWRAAQGKDVIYISSVNYFYFAFLAAIVHRFLRRRLVYHFHDLINKPSRRLHLLSFFTTDFVHNTRFGLDLVAKQNRFVRRSKNWIIPFAISARPNMQTSINKEGGKALGHNILFVGQVAKHKGVDLLLDAFRLLNLSKNDVMLHVVGTCTDADLEKRMKQNKGTNGSRIKYWGYRGDVLNMMKAADVYVHPSPPSRFQESFGRGVVEAMSVGTPAVCFASGALQEIVIDGKTGFLCEEESASCLAKNIERLLHDDELRARCGRSSFEEYQRHYSKARIRSRWLVLLGREDQPVELA
jgi:glycosyltransferase involved in cell wall biosynthesis